MEKDCFVREIEANGDMMYRVAFTILHNDDACRDALQGAALKAWEKRGSLRDEKVFKTWITRILINECCDIRRKRRRVGVAVPGIAVDTPLQRRRFDALHEIDDVAAAARFRRIAAAVIVGAPIGDLT